MPEAVEDGTLDASAITGDVRFEGVGFTYDDTREV
jgi:hypothetical protein